MKRRKLARFVGGLAVITLITASCVPVVSPIPLIPSMSTVGRGDTPSFPLPTFEGLFPTKPYDPTPLPTRAPTAKPFPQWTPLPTLSDIEAEAQLLNWLQGTPDCLLPCWAGIMPGLTTWQEAKQILGTVVDFRVVDENGICISGLCNLIEWRGRTPMDFHGYIIGDTQNSIYKIILDGGPPTPIMRLDRILAMYGSPEMVFVDAFISYLNPLENIKLYLTLAYPKHQFIIRFSWSGFLSEQNIAACIQNEYIELYIQPVEVEWSKDFVRNEVHGMYSSSNPFLTLEEATGMSIEEFYNTFKTIEGDECIQTPVEPWLYIN